MKGLTLLEVVISSFLLALVLMLVLNLLPSSLAGLRQTDHRQRAHGIAQSELAQAMAAPFSSLATRELASQHWDGTRYEGRLEVTSRSPRLLALRVRVRWQERGQLREIVREQWRVRIQR